MRRTLDEITTSHPLDELIARMGVAVPHELLQLALTHPSAVAEGTARTLHSNQRLEFLGDAVIGLVAAGHLFDSDSTQPEGILTQRKAAAVRGSSLAEAGKRLELDRYMRLGRGDDVRTGRGRDSILADAFEAVAGAVFVANGWEAARDFILRCLQVELAAVVGEAASEKNRLQELTQARGWGTPVYSAEATGGPAHARHFSACVLVQGEERGRGEGRSKKEAESRAAASALSALAGAAVVPEEPVA